MTRHDWEDINAVCVIERGAAWIDFKCYDIMGHSADNNGKFTVPFFEKLGAEGSDDTTEKLEEAQTLVQGTIKWDACSHVNFGEEGYVHMCGKESWAQMSELLRRVFTEAGKLLKEGHNDDWF
jgi:hypothetical protein